MKKGQCFIEKNLLLNVVQAMSPISKQLGISIYVILTEIGAEIAITVETVLYATHID